ncbi:Multidrug resistance protein MdtG [uncultured archaeon]|nr:Multidrug resistance protein MdtG [uncultured archaeon]
MSFKDILATPGVIATLFTLFMVAFGFGVILPILPFYALAHGAKPAELGMLTATFAAMSLLFSPLMGKLADRWGRKRILLIGTAGFAFGYLLFAATNSLEMAFVGRAIEGISAAAIFPACLSLLADFTTEAQRSRAMNMVSMAFSLGLIMGPAFGGLAAGISVQAAFLLSAVMAAINFLCVWRFVQEPPAKPSGRDIVAQEAGLLSHLASPLLFLFMGTFMVAFMFGGLDATLALFTSERMGFGSAQIGLLFTYIGVLVLLMQFAGDYLISKYGELVSIPAGLALSGSGFLLLAFTHDWLTILIPIAIFISGNALVFPSVNSLISKKVGGKRGGVMGLVSSFQSSGQLVGPLVGGALYGIDHRYPFLAMAAVILSYALFFVLFARPKLKGVPDSKSDAGEAMAAVH